MISFKQYILIESPKEIEYDQTTNAIPKNRYKTKNLSSGKKQLEIHSAINKNKKYTHELNKLSSIGDYEFARKSKNFSKEYVTDNRHWDYIRHPKTDKPLVKVTRLKDNVARPATFYAIHKPTGEVHMKVEGEYTPSCKKFQVGCLSGHPDSKLKAHEFYQHLLLAGHVKELHSDTTQSIGGRKVWNRLRKLPNVKMVTNENPNGHHLKNFDKHYTSDKEYDEIKAKHSKKVNDPFYGSYDHTNWDEMKKDKQHKRFMKLSDRHFIAKSKV